MHRFFVDRPLLAGAQQGTSVALSGQQAHQIGRVLRLKAGSRVVLLDGAGRELLVLVQEVRPSAVVGRVEAVLPGRPEPRLQLTLYQALVPRERFETVLQKGTEVGVARFVPTWCERSIVPGGDAVDTRRLDRWQRIVTEAAEQCERGIVPEVAPPLRLPEAIAEATAAGPVLIAWERETSRSLRGALASVLDGPGAVHATHEPVSRQRLALFVGPEGGFAEREVELAASAGALTVSLGPRILRTETAGPVLAALALYDAGDLDPAPPSDATLAAP